MAEKQKINRCKDCAMSRPSPFGGRYCTCLHHGRWVSFPKMGKACELFVPRKELEK